MKSSILWFIIIVLLLRVHYYWLEDKDRKEAGKHWESRQKQIIHQMEVFSCDDMYHDMPFDEAFAMLKEIYFDKILNLKEDPDFRVLSEPEQNKFFKDARWHVLGAWDLCRQSPRARQAAKNEQAAKAERASLSNR